MTDVPGQPHAAPPQAIFVNANDPRAGLVTGPERWVVAPLRLRTAAWFVDVIIVLAATTVVFLPVWALDSDAAPFSDGAGVLATTTGGSTTSELLVTVLGNLVAWAIWVAYAAESTVRPGKIHGQTLGMRLFGVRVLMENGDPLERGEAWRRAVVLPTLLLWPTIIGTTLDAAFASQPALSNAADALEFVVIAVVLGAALVRGDRRTPYDDWSQTVVIAAKAVGVRAPDAPVPFSRDLPIEERSHDWVTWLFGVIAAILLLFAIVSSLLG